MKVQQLVQHVVCELKDAVETVLVDDIAFAPKRTSVGVDSSPRLAWLYDWSAQLTFTLTVDEKGAFNPSASVNSVLPNAVKTFSGKPAVSIPQSSSVGLAAAVSTQATTKQTFAIRIKLRDLVPIVGIRAMVPARLANISAGVDSPKRDCKGQGQPFLSGDLRLREWLRSQTIPAGVRGAIYGDYEKALLAAEKAAKKDALSDQITFVLIYGGSATPGWKLVDFSANQGSLPFLSAQRTNTQDVIITLASPGPKGDLSQTANNITLSSLIGTAVSNALRNNQ